MTLSGVRKVFYGIPLVALVAAGALLTSRTEAAVDAAATADAVLTPAPEVAVEDVEAVEATTDELEFPADSMMIINNCTYYNNAQHTQIVGQFGYDCCNNPVAWGKKTRYYDCGGCFPCFPPPQ